ncbi:MAG: sulfatase-like hydrolase/transferase, partial [Candidatus Latescibacteria bacterium]|nr:sulfatase-like hydrolase/transferase [Candidatus Latescibacterota bacterium]
MAQRPNILWVSFEDCYPYFGCYGDKVARTPHLDRLAAEGALWTRAFSTAPVCSPARSGVITGMYPTAIGTHHHRTGSGKNYDSLAYSYEAVVPHYVRCFSEYLRAAGYYCSNNDKTDYQFA